MNIARYSDGIIISGLSDFSLAECLTSGQTFRWQPQGAGFCGVALGRAVYAEQRGDALLLCGVGIKDADAFVRFFDLERDYGAVKAAYAGDPFLREGMGYAPGMRVLRQPHFETLISFIISANNNLRRIMGIVERLCARCGAPIEGGFDFPTPGALAALGEDALREIGAGYRARFIAAAARAVAEGFSLDDVARMPYEEARQTLAKLPGVGLKVADCVALYGMGFTQAFPADVWMRRVLCGVYGYRGKNDKELRAFVDGRFGEYAGLAQQYLFHYARHHREAVCAPRQESAARKEVRIHAD